MIETRHHSQAVLAAAPLAGRDGARSPTSVLTGGYGGAASTLPLLAGRGENDGGGEKKNGDDAGVTGRPRSVRQLRGGIVAYARDVLGAEAGAEAGAETKSAYKGLNFVFDNRGAVPVTSDVVTWCDGCGAKSNRLGKCAGFGCHVILVVCEACGGGGNGDGNGAEARVFCCGSCEAQEIARAETTAGAKLKRKPCECDGYEARRRRLLPTPTFGSAD